MKNMPSIYVKSGFYDEMIRNGLVPKVVVEDLLRVYLKKLRAKRGG